MKVYAENKCLVSTLYIETIPPDFKDALILMVNYVTKKIIVRKRDNYKLFQDDLNLMLSPMTDKKQCFRH
jgi:hypothetical protein